MKFLHCSVIALSIDLSLRMTFHFTGQAVRVVLGIAISIAVVPMKLGDNRSDMAKDLDEERTVHPFWCC